MKRELWGRSAMAAVAAAMAVTLAGCGGAEEPAPASERPQQEAASTTTAVEPAVPKPPEAVTDAGGASGGEALPATSPPAPAPVQSRQPAAAAPDPEPAASAEPTTHEIRGVVTQWSPMILFAQPGDTVVFRQMTGHDSETIEGMFPQAAKPWKSSLGQEGFSVTLSEPGAYIYKCNPHVSTGMVGAIVVGDVPPANLAALEAHPQNKGMIGRAIRKLKQALDAAP